MKFLFCLILFHYPRYVSPNQTFIIISIELFYKSDSIKKVLQYSLNTRRLHKQYRLSSDINILVFLVPAFSNIQFTLHLTKKKRRTLQTFQI